MNNKLMGLTGIAVLVTSATAFAGTVTGLSFTDNGNDAVVITDNTGTPITAGTGFVSLGYFTIDDADVQLGMDPGSFMTTLESFVSVSSGSFADEGLYFLSTDYGIGGLNGQAGRTWYTLMGSGADADNSNEFVLYQHSVNIPTDSVSPPVPAGSDLLLDDDGSQLFGGTGGAKTVDATNLLGDSNYTGSSSFTMTAVPEPSSTTLLGLGVLGFALRRRR